MNIGEAGDRWSLARVVVAALAVGVVLGALGYVFDLVAGPTIGMSGWWTVCFFGGIILGAAKQGVREFAVPRPEERAALAAEARAAAAAEPGPSVDQGSA
ncbi:MAG: hypothetical protein IT305_03630 [Chloroflexi bacterium]|nr:hypothetical protein [Chloroflexota bacterium]